VNRLTCGILAAAFWGLVSAGPLTAEPRAWVVASPSHGQTFAYGSEKHRQWIARGPDHHLALSTEFTNDPYVDRTEPRQYDDFIFDFPSITLGRSGRTFYYHAPGGRAVPVAIQHRGLFGLDEIDLLATSFLVLHKPHGFLSFDLVVANRALKSSDDSER